MDEKKKLSEVKGNFFRNPHPAYVCLLSFNNRMLSLEGKKVPNENIPVVNVGYIIPAVPSGGKMFSLHLHKFRW